MKSIQILSILLLLSNCLTALGQCDSVVANMQLEPLGKGSEALQCTDRSQNATSWHWDFGDGTTSTERHPQKSFSSPGLSSLCTEDIPPSVCSSNYKVCLTVSNACSSQTFCDTVWGVVYCRNCPSKYDEIPILIKRDE